MGKLVPTESLPYRRGVGIVLMNRERRILTAQRINDPTRTWQMPQGGIEAGEAPEKALRREVLEELGCNNFKVITALDSWVAYDFPPHIGPQVKGGGFRGQQHKWFVAEFLGDDSEINIETDVPEFRDWKWTEPIKIIEEAISFKKNVYKYVLEQFSTSFY